MARPVTLLDLVAQVARQADTEMELLETVVRLVNSGQVRLCGTFAGTLFDPALARHGRALEIA